MSSAGAGSATQSSDRQAKLRWQTHRTIADRSVANAKRDAASSGTARESTGTSVAKQPDGRRLTQPSEWQARGSRRVASPQRTTGRVDSRVVQASADKSDPFQDPFEDDPVPDKFGKDSTTRTSQPTPPVADALRGAPDEPQPLPTDADSFPTYESPDPLDDTLPENRSVVESFPPPLDMSCGDYQKECAKQIKELRSHDITKIVFGIVIEGEDGKPPVEGSDYPCECVLGVNARFLGRNWEPTTFTWKATGTCFKPLYFQDVQLERYGHSWNPVVQPFMSAAHFFVSVPLLPYKMGLRAPNECVYTLGYYRPGNCAPYMIEPIPFTLRAAAYQALGTTGFAFWFWPPPTGP